MLQKEQSPTTLIGTDAFYFKPLDLSRGLALRGAQERTAQALGSA